MIDTILTTLTDDDTLMATLTGGVYRAKEISRQATPDAYDTNLEIKPCALLRQESVTPIAPHHDSARAIITVWFYQRSGYDAIEAARARVYALLHRTQVVGWDVRHSNDLVDMEDPALGLPMAVSRYVCTINRA